MKIKLLLIVLLVQSFQLTAQENTSVPIPDIATIDQWRKENNVPAIAIATIEQNKIKKIVVRGNTKENIPATSKTVFDVASLTKTITAILSLQLVSNGSLDLDEPLYPYWVDPDVKNDLVHKKLTTRHILSHTTGFKNWRRMYDDKKLAFDFEPGTKFQYSGEGFEYLRKALEAKFKTSFEQLVDSLVFKPNNMMHSSLVWNKRMETSTFANTHNKEGKPYSYDKATKANAADNLLTTIEDFGNIAVNILQRKHLTEKMYVAMEHPQVVVKDGVHFGLGCIVLKDLPNGEYAIFNAGSDTGVNAIIIVLPKSKRGLIVFTNGDNGRALAMKMIAETLGDTGKEILSRF
ncbi:serine hydrolase domain-containing protein [Kordia sp.]|uniref:serine hydrolase domain-containing protein n=1 Tax=Kordia sp. TaxID=1965332 RepID=UPI003D2D6EE4